MKANATTLYGFSKSERITEKKLISQIFREGKSIFLYPLLTKYIPLPVSISSHHKILISVSSKKIRSAVDRNLVKRRIREAYRLNKVDFNFSDHYLIAYIYVSDEILTYKLVETKLRESLQRLSKSVNKLNNE